MRSNRYLRIDFPNDSICPLRRSIQSTASAVGPPGYIAISGWTARFDHPVGVLLVSLHVLKFGRELDPHQSPRERAPRDRLSRASR